MSLRRLRRRDRLLLLVHVRAHRRLRPRARAAPARGRRREPRQDRRAARRLGRRRSTAARSSAARSASPTSTRSPSELHGQADRRSPSAPVRVEPRLARATSSPARTRRSCCYALAPIFNAEMKSLVDAGATYLQLEDLGAWLPLFTGDDADYEWISDVIGQCCDGVDAKIGWHFCFGNAWGNDILSHNFPRGLPDGPAALLSTRRASTSSCSTTPTATWRGIEFLKNLPRRQGSPGRRARHPHDDGRDARAGGRAARARCSSTCRADRVTLSTDCGMKPLPRHDREDEAQGARRRRQDRPAREIA